MSEESCKSLQPSDEAGLNFPQIAGFQVNAVDPVSLLQIVAFQVNTSDITPELCDEDWR